MHSLTEGYAAAAAAVAAQAGASENNILLNINFSTQMWKIAALLYLERA